MSPAHCWKSLHGGGSEGAEVAQDRVVGRGRRDRFLVEPLLGGGQPHAAAAPPQSARGDLDQRQAAAGGDRQGLRVGVGPLRQEVLPDLLRGARLLLDVGPRQLCSRSGPPPPGPCGTSAARARGQGCTSGRGVMQSSAVCRWIVERRGDDPGDAPLLQGVGEVGGREAVEPGGEARDRASGPPAPGVRRGARRPPRSSSGCAAAAAAAQGGPAQCACGHRLRRHTGTVAGSRGQPLSAMPLPVRHLRWLRCPQPDGRRRRCRDGRTDAATPGAGGRTRARAPSRPPHRPPNRPPRREPRRQHRARRCTGTACGWRAPRR